MTGPARHPLTSAAPTRPAMSLLDMALTPDGEIGLDGLPVGDRWERGFTWLPRLCGGISGRNDCEPSASVDYRTNASTGKRSHQPVILVAENECPSTFGMDWDYEYRTADDLLIACEPAGVEQEMWDGTLARAAITAGDDAFDNNLWLTKYNVATVLTDDAVSLARGIALLEQFLASSGCGGQGMIHVQPSFVPAVGVRVVGRQMFTNVGNFIVPGSGYTGNGPASSDGGNPATPAAGTAWIYATGRVTYRSGPIQHAAVEPGQAIDRKTNTVAITAQRSTAATWDSCAVGAALVTLPA